MALWWSFPVWLPWQLLNDGNHALSSYRLCIQIMIIVVMLSSGVHSQSQFYSFTGCSSAIYRVHGASITSQRNNSYHESNQNCSMIFKLPNSTSMQFNLQLVYVDMRGAVDGVCPDILSVKQNTKTLLGPLCGNVSGPVNMSAEAGATVQIIWKTGSAVTGTFSGFHIILTAVNLPVPSVSCSRRQLLACLQTSYCISRSLRCDNVSNCPGDSDEENCTEFYRPGLSTPNTTTNTHISSITDVPPVDSNDTFQEVDMVSIIVVGVLFVAILLICVILACRSKSGDLEALTEESNQLRLDISSNAGYQEGDGRPATPPPTYSMIERQTSYVSQISMSSSQISEPPEYDEALKLDSQGNVIPRRSSSSARRHSSRAGNLPVRSASGYARTRPRITNRSHSTEESYRPRFQSQVSEVTPIDENSVMDFSESFSPVISERSDNPMTSTPHPVMLSMPNDFCNIEMIRDDSHAPLFRMHDSNNSPIDNDNLILGQGNNRDSNDKPQTVVDVNRIDESSS